VSRAVNTHLERRILQRLAVRAMLRRHVDGDFGGIGRFDPDLASEEARDLGVLAPRVARNTIAIIDQATDILSTHESERGMNYCVWTILGRDSATIVFTPNEEISVF
jgi:hypothetical protein